MLALLLANIGYFAWTQRLLADYGFAPATQAEPQRMAQQIRPQAMRLIPASDARQNDAAAPPAKPTKAAASASATQCLQAGLFTEPQAKALSAHLQSRLPAGSWRFESAVEPGRWIVYMGPYGNEEALAKKRAELRQLGLAVEPLIKPALGPGLSLGHFSAPLDAERELARAVSRGVRSASVVLEQPEARGQRLKLPSVDASLMAQLEALKPQLEGRALEACR